MRAVFVIPLLVQGCGAWALHASSSRPSPRPSQGSEPLLQRLNPTSLAFTNRIRCRRLAAIPVDGDSPAGASANNDGDGGVNTVKARLSKPVGLVLAEKEIGQPGLVVDDMADGGSAKVCSRYTWFVSRCRKEANNRAI